MKVSWDDDIPNIWKNKNGPKHQPDIQLSPLPSDNQRHQRWEWNIPHFNPFHTYFIHGRPFKCPFLRGFRSLPIAMNPQLAHPDDRLRLKADSRRMVVSSKWTWNQQE
jgi:hypothetical protein